jgi:hypothetical protein
VNQWWTRTGISFTTTGPKQPNGLAGESHGSVILFRLSLQCPWSSTFVNNSSGAEGGGAPRDATRRHRIGLRCSHRAAMGQKLSAISTPPSKRPVSAFAASSTYRLRGKIFVRLSATKTLQACVRAELRVQNSRSRFSRPGVLPRAGPGNSPPSRSRLISARAGTKAATFPVRAATLSSFLRRRA